MVYLHSWHDFQDAAEALYAKSPNTARYVVKYKHNEGKLVLKITDDRTCLKFKTNSSVFLNRFEALNLSLMRKMQNTKPPAAPPAADVEMREATPVPATPAPAAPAQITSAAGGGGVKKKKGKKKK
ncbi:signal recognition particle, SRP9/SRP14 subunit [Schizophyllum commune]